MMYVWIGIGIVLLITVTKLVKAWNAPRVSEADKEKAEAIQRERTERLRIRKENRRRKKSKF